MITIAFNTAVHFMVTSAVQLKQSRLTVAFDHLPCPSGKRISPLLSQPHTLTSWQISKPTLSLLSRGACELISFSNWHLESLYLNSRSTPLSQLVTLFLIFVIRGLSLLVEQVHFPHDRWLLSFAQGVVPVL